ncbi:hypothetical protein GGU11DRAFT_750347 [Lentinula aff. detonsa]|nr:hypothetical protein GGU11DRAFT_750347 [Lentinula aff. detonsa]
MHRQKALIFGVLFDDFNEIDEETECLVLLIPCAKFPESHPLNTSNSPLHPTNQSSRRPKLVSQSAADNVDIVITPSNCQSQFRLPDFEGGGYPLPIEPRIPKMTPSVKYQPSKQPLQLHFSIDFRRDIETQWKAACTLSPKLKGVKFKARCFQRCENAMACQHEQPFQKCIIFDRLVLCGGLALVPHKFGDLKNVESIDDALQSPT